MQISFELVRMAGNGCCKCVIQSIYDIIDKNERLVK